MKIYVDFDNTIYCTSRLTECMLKKIADCCAEQNSDVNFESALFECRTLFCREKIYNIYRLCEYIAKKYEVSVDNLKNCIDNIIENGQEFLYDDSIEFLEKLKQSNFQIVLLTRIEEDNLAYQKKKVAGSGLIGYFDDIVYTTTSKSKLNLDYEKSVFVDDNPTEIANLCLTDAKIVVRVKRADCKYSKTEIKNSKIIEIENLKQFDFGEYLVKYKIA